MMTEDKYTLTALVAIVIVVLVALYRSSKGGPMQKGDVNNHKYFAGVLIGIAIFFWILCVAGYTNLIDMFRSRCSDASSIFCGHKFW